FPGAIDDWFHLLNQGSRPTGLANSDSHASLGEEPGLPRTYLRLGSDQPASVDAPALIGVIKRDHAATLSEGPFLTFTVAEGAGTPVGIGGELAAPSGKVTVSYKLAAPSWVSVSRLQIYVNGLITQMIRVD